MYSQPAFILHLLCLFTSIVTKMKRLIKMNEILRDLERGCYSLGFLNSFYFYFILTLIFQFQFSFD